MAIKNDTVSVLELENVKDIYLCGDIHGEFAELVCKMERYKIQDSVVIVCGDCGFGFENSGYYPHIYEKKLERKLIKYNNIILCIRGNHDDPRYFDDPEYIPTEMTRLRTLPSNTLLKVCRYNILCIGGAISIDREERIEFNKTLKPKKPKVYWPEEKIIQINEIEQTPHRIDIILSHDAPISFDPPLLRKSKMSNDLWNDILEIRNYLEKINKGIKPERWYYGHYHKSFSGSTGKTIWRGLDILEIVQIPPKAGEVLGSILESDEILLSEKEKSEEKKKRIVLKKK